MNSALKSLDAASENQLDQAVMAESNLHSPATLRNFRLLAGVLFFLMLGLAAVVQRLMLNESSDRFAQSSAGRVEFLSPGKNIIKDAHPGILFEVNPIKTIISDMSIQLTEEHRNAKSVSFCLWDYSAEDGDIVQIFHDDVPLGGPIELKHIPVMLQCPSGGILTIRALDSGTQRHCSYGFHLYGTQETILNMQDKNQDCIIRLLPHL